jgi:hypothetical protein
MNDSLSTGTPPTALDTQTRLRRARIFKIGGTIASLALFAVSLVVLYYVMGRLDANEVKGAFSRASWQQIGLALFFTALSYTMLTGYDWVALPGVTAQKVRYRVAALASFTSYAVSFYARVPAADGGDGALEDIAVLFAEGVEVKAFDAGEVFVFEEV